MIKVIPETCHLSVANCYFVGTKLCIKMFIIYKLFIIW